MINKILHSLIGTCSGTERQPRYVFAGAARKRLEKMKKQMNDIAIGVNWEADHPLPNMQQFIAEDARERAMERYLTNSFDTIENSEHADEPVACDDDTDDLRNRVIELLDRLRDGLQYAVVEQAGEHWYMPYTEDSTYDFLQDTTSRWIMHVAEDGNTRSDVLEQLAYNHNAEVRMAVADNPNTTLDVLRLLAKDEDADVRYAVAENHNIDMGILDMLAEDDNPYVADRAHRTIARLNNGLVVNGSFEQRTQLECVRAISR